MIPNTNPKEQILEILRTQGVRCEKEILNQLSPKGFDSKFRFSAITIKRAISDLTSDGEIIKIETKNLKTYGIYNKDKRFKYFNLKENEKEQKFISRLIESLGSKDSVEREIALRELNGNNYLKLVSTQLDKLVDIIINQNFYDKEECIFAIEVLTNHIHKGILPTQEKIDELTTEIYNRYNETPLDDLYKHTTFGNLIKILGLLNSKLLIKIISDLAEKGVLEENKKTFYFWEVSKCINDNSLEMYDLQIKHKGKSRIQSAIYDIKKQANESSMTHKENFLIIERALQSMQKRK